MTTFDKSAIDRGGPLYATGVAKGDMAKYVLLPRDPDRVTRIANHLDDPQEIARNREFVTVTPIRAHPSPSPSPRPALDLASAARERGDHPFGALLVIDGKVIETARNRAVSDGDLTARAELTLVRKSDRSGQTGAGFRWCGLLVARALSDVYRSVVLGPSASRCVCALP